MPVLEAVERSINRLRTGMGRSKTSLSKWDYADTACIHRVPAGPTNVDRPMHAPGWRSLHLAFADECSQQDLATAKEARLMTLCQSLVITTMTQPQSRLEIKGDYSYEP